MRINAKTIKLVIITAIGLLFFNINNLPSLAANNIGLEGNGTYNDPYLIQNLVDLNEFRDLVNGGEHFEDKYFLQTTDIDMATEQNWEPIGIFGEKYYFSGTYNGNGHYVFNVDIDQDENCAFFTVLGGTVMNFGIESGIIKGLHTASLAGHAIGDNAKIINCYNKATIYGSARAGGIVDNFNGTVVNCVNLGSLISPVKGEICAYNVTNVLLSYGKTDRLIPEDTFNGYADKCAAFLSSAEGLQASINQLNKNVFYLKQNTENCFKQLTYWQCTEDSISFKSQNVYSDWEAVPFLVILKYLSKVITIVIVLLIFVKLLMSFMKTKKDPNVLINSEFYNFKHEKLVFAIVLIGVSLVYFSFYLYRTIPYTEGWGLFYSGLIKDGKFPYRDFYYYLPPLNLILDSLLWDASFGKIIIYRIWRLLERELIIVIFYLLLTKVAKPRYAWIASFLGIILATATVYDLGGDYNQTCDLALILLCWSLVNWATSFHNNEERKEKRWLFLAGFIIGLSFLLKQTIFAAEVILFFVLLTVLVIKKKKKYFPRVFTTVFGALVPVAITMIILLMNGAFKAFWEQVFIYTDSKGSFADILLAAPRIVLTKENILPALIFIGMFYLWFKIKHYGLTIDLQRKASAIFVIVIINTFLLNYYTWFTTSSSVMKFPYGVIVKGLLLLSLLICFLPYQKNDNSCMQMLLFVLPIYLTVLFVCSKSEFAQMIYEGTESFSLIERFAGIISLAGFVVVVYLLNLYIKKDNLKMLHWLILTVGGCVCCYYVSMSNIDRMSGRAVFILAPILVLILINHNLQFNTLKNTFLLISVVFICMVCTSQKVVNAYAWWGWNSDVLTDENSYKIEVSALEGFRVSENIKNMYEELFAVIDSNTDKNSVIYGFPHVKIFNVLLDNYNMNYFVPVPFYDVCADEYAESEASILEKETPDVVIWCDMPGCMETHEYIFRNGKKLGQRKIQEWFSEAVKNKDYILVGQYDALFIYKKVNDIPIGYTYIKDSTAKNLTLTEQ